ncbi:major facilitator superfamily domain-containing protein 12-like isoform X2 [Antedon mediterranea]|uniref:major facilitator superfamily domain-containing protein 12-like isoform X2 n=1 Tax=Antedon mediterranea TaxID=105859 RepID=UPI003AF49172
MTSEEPKTLSLVRRYTYGVGHVLNDLCASMWFSYLLLFFHQVLKFENNIAGYLMLLGQITDGICTPLIGYESDRKDISCRYGKRKTWHLIGTRENASIGNRSIQANNQRSKPMRWRCWLKQIQFYQVAMIYMCARLMVNISQVYIPMYLLETLQSNKDSVAIIPLVVYVSSFLASVFVKFVNDHLGRKITYGIGALLILVACVCFYFIHNGKYIYIPTVLLGVGGSTVLVTSLSMTADLINLNTESGAFVYGAMSFTDKLSNGIVIAVIQQFHPCRTCCDKCGRFYREILSFVPGAAAIISLVVLLTLIPVNIGKRDNIVALEDNEDERKALLACAQETNAYIEEDPART